MRVIPQRSTAYLELSFFDNAGIAMPPSSAVYRIVDLGSTTVILADTNFIVPPTGAYTIRLSPDNNDLVDPLNKMETHRVIVTGFFNIAGDEIPGAYDYGISRIQVN